jgi:hypothetical protein
VGAGLLVVVILVSGSPEERHLYVDQILAGQNCRIVLCSIQYVADVQRTLDYFINNNFALHVQWLNPGFNDPGPVADHLGLVDTILGTRRSIVSLRDGTQDAERRVQEIREFIHGWALYRDLIRYGS